jgi:hypothetical protein
MNKPKTKNQKKKEKQIDSVEKKETLPQKSQ